MGSTSVEGATYGSTKQTTQSTSTIVGESDEGSSHWNTLSGLFGAFQYMDELSSYARVVATQYRS